MLQTEKLHITKVWDDSSNTAGLRPDDLSVTVDNMNFTLSGDGDNWTIDATILKKKNLPTTASERLEDINYSQVGAPVIESAVDGVNVVFTNKLNTTKITVKKDWNDGDATGRPNFVKFRLNYRESGSNGEWKSYGDYTITKEDNEGTNAWTEVISNLPIAYEYQVVELNDKDEPATADNYGNYVPTVTQDGTTYTMTNTLKWFAKKVSESWDDTQNESVGLKGAEFELKQGDTVIATGKSGDGGSITWTVKDQTTDLYQLNGNYTIHETKAPTGYMLHEDWTVTFTNGLLTQLDGQNIAGSAADGVVITLADKAVYVLPETGGSGIYWYSICGILLMMAAAWILYKNKCREVLVK